MFSGDLRPHRKILTCVASAICLCLLISIYKTDISRMYAQYKLSFRSDCQNRGGRSDTHLPPECNVSIPHDVHSSQTPAKEKLEEHSNLAAKEDRIRSKASKLSSETYKQNNLSKFQFIINEESLCKAEKGEPVVLLVGVFTGLDEAPLRKFIRNYWGKIAKQNPKVKLVFIIGQPRNKLFDLAPIKNESSMYHDIVQANFADTYRNLTLKSLALFQWTGTYCKDAKFVLKIDGDMKIDVLRLIGVLEKNNFPDKYHCGYIIPASDPMRDKNSKWYVPSSVYPRRYPVYCAGPAYLVSKRIADKISRYPIPKVPFPVDDAFMTGILREELHEGVEKRIISFYHHHNPTDTVVQDGKFKKYIMKIDVTS